MVDAGGVKGVVLFELVVLDVLAAKNCESELEMVVCGSETFVVASGDVTVAMSVQRRIKNGEEKQVAYERKFSWLKRRLKSWNNFPRHSVSGAIL